MPRAARICGVVRCTELVPAGGECPRHPRRARRRPDDRRSARERGYDAAWERLRAEVLADEPLCRACAARGAVEPATDVDHVVPKARGGTDDRSNLQPLCHACHSRKTATEDGGFGRLRPTGDAACQDQ